MSIKPYQIQYEIAPLDEIVETLLDFIKIHFKDDPGFCSILKLNLKLLNILQFIKKIFFV